MNYITWIQKSYGLDILVDGILIILLVVEAISILFAYLSEYFVRKFSILRDPRCLFEHVVFQQVLDLLVVAHFGQLMHGMPPNLVGHKDKYSLVFNLNLINKLV